MTGPEITLRLVRTAKKSWKEIRYKHRKLNPKSPQFILVWYRRFTGHYEFTFKKGNRNFIVDWFLHGTINCVGSTFLLAALANELPFNQVDVVSVKAHIYPILNYKGKRTAFSTNRRVISGPVNRYSPGKRNQLHMYLKGAYYQTLALFFLSFDVERNPKQKR